MSAAVSLSASGSHGDSTAGGGAVGHSSAMATPQRVEGPDGRGDDRRSGKRRYQTLSHLGEGEVSRHAVVGHHMHKH